MTGQALIVVDVQNDFCAGGSLEVKGSETVAQNIAELMDAPHWDLIIVSKDDHVLGDNGGHISETPDYVDTWPAHCIQGTVGNLWHPEIRKAFSKNIDRCAAIFKGRGKPAYSVFEGHTVDGSPTAELLARMDITDVTVVGLALDYCVKATALDARQLKIRSEKLKVTLPLGYTAAVANATGAEAIAEMRRAGVYIP